VILGNWNLTILMKIEAIRKVSISWNLLSKYLSSVLTRQKNNTRDTSNSGSIFAFMYENVLRTM